MLRVILSLFVIISIVVGGEEKRLVFGVLKTSRDTKLKKKINSITKYLRKELKVQIKLYYSVDAKAIIKGIKYNLIDFAYLDALSLYKAIYNKKYIKGLVSEKGYKISYLVASKASNINYLSEITPFDKIAVVNKEEASFKYLERETLFSDNYINFIKTYSNEKSLKKLVKSNSKIKGLTRGIKPSTINRRIKNQFVAALVDSVEYRNFLREYSKEDYRVIWKSPKIPNNGIVINRRLKRSTRELLKKALLSYHSKVLISYCQFVPFNIKEYLKLKSFIK